MEISTPTRQASSTDLRRSSGTLETQEAILGSLQDQVVALVAKWGYERREEHFELSSGFKSRDYIDGKRAISTTSRLRLVGDAIVTLASSVGVSFTAVGGLTMGADPIALAVALAGESEKHWFSVRKQEKKHGKQKLVEGAELGPESRVLLVDDVVTTGRSILRALDGIKDTGAEIVLAVALVDRGEGATQRLAERGVLYRPVITYRDLGIEPVPS